MENTALRYDAELLGDALLLSCLNAQWHVVKWLLDNLSFEVNHIEQNKNSAISAVIDGSNILRDRLLEAACEGRVEDISQLSAHFSGNEFTLGEALRRACKCGQLNVVMWLVMHTELRDESDILGESLFLSSAYTQWHVAQWLARVPQVDVDYTGSDENNVVSIVINNVEMLGYRLWQAAREGRVDNVIQLSAYYTNDVNTLKETLREACKYDRLNVVMWLVKHTELIYDIEACSSALTLACSLRQFSELIWLVEHTVLGQNGTALGNAVLATARKDMQWYAVKKWLKLIDSDVIITGPDSKRLVTLYDCVTNIMNSTSISWPTTPSSFYYRFVPEVKTYDFYYRPMTEEKTYKSVYVLGEDVNARDGDGDTLLHQVCLSFPNNSEIVGALLLAGADENIANGWGLTPEKLAMQLNSYKSLPLLDVSSKWKLLVRSHRLRRRTAVRVMMTLVKWKVQQVRKWSNLLVSSLHQLKSLSVTISSEMSLKQIWDITEYTNGELWTFEYLGVNRNRAAVINWLTVMFIRILCKRFWISRDVYKAITSWSLLDVSSKWKMLVRSHHLRWRRAVRVMMTLVKWRMRQIRSMWTRTIMTLHTMFVLAN